MLVEAAAVEQASKLEKPTSICKCQHYLSAFCAPSHGHHQVECLIATNQETSCNVTLCPALFSAVLEREGLVLTLRAEIPTSDGFLLLISKWMQACAGTRPKGPKNTCRQKMQKEASCCSKPATEVASSDRTGFWTSDLPWLKTSSSSGFRSLCSLLGSTRHDAKLWDMN